MTKRFAFAGRVSTEDQQDPVASRNWQLNRAQALIEPVGGIVVAEYFDIAHTRALPWKRRPRSAALLEALKDPNRGFDAVVIGEPQRAFYGNQFGLTYPVFVHYGVEMWVPEVGGPIDPESEAHDLVMSVFGGMSKAERQRIKVRVRAAMTAQAKIEGRYLGGRPPYGYRLADAGPHPNPAKAADGRRLHRLEPDPVTAPVVARIFADYLSGTGIHALAERLTRDGVPSPSAHDRARNPHRSGVAWAKGAVRAILINPRYTGHEVWNKQRKHERLLDVDDVALGHETKLAWNPQEAWVYSDTPAHPALVSQDLFRQVQQRLHARNAASTGRAVRTRHPYALKGRMFHSSCGRRMQGNWNNGTAHYRCRFPSEYALANTLDHPRTVYVREDAVLPPLDAWLATAFAPDRIRHVLTALEDAQPDRDLRVEGARQTLADCDRKLARHRAALEAGADPHLVTTWSRDVQKERAAAEYELARITGEHRNHGRMSRDEIRALIDALGGMLTVIRHADPTGKAEIYKTLGLHLTYEHETRKVLAETRPAPTMCVVKVSEGGLEPPCPCGH
ncbi:recombinase family protein [Yinghuangia sp. YIM S10712]|uniref:recombinase family protein n=1 Tax=Yinghuangia sp. YIM S10712 TaxID=3436930 RepID=UPI003F537B0F